MAETTAPPVTITDFLEARIAEDAAVAVGRAPSPWGTLNVAGHARVLAECEAKRRIIARHRDDGQGQHRCAWGEWTDDPCDDLRDLAAAYADHPDYREEWRP